MTASAHAPPQPAAPEQPDESAPRGREKRRHIRYADGTRLLLSLGSRHKRRDDDERYYQAWSHNISEGGIGFFSLHKFDTERLTVRVELPKSGSAVFEVDIVRTREVIDGLWEYGAIFRGLSQTPETNA